jgi:ABC-2 type transport system ATP-binding protein
MLQVTTISRSFGGHRVLEDVSFDVRPGRMTGFLGANGSGKTTTMRIILGVLAAHGGSVTWRGAPVTQAVRQRFGYMPEERGLYPKMRVAEQIAWLGQLHGLSPAQAKTNTDRLLGQLELAERADDKLEALSLGNQQRVQVAAALVHDPALLILDEPFSGLDPLAIETVLGVLRGRAANGVPVLFSSHQLDLVERLCDAVGIIQAGRMVATGPVEELRTRGRGRRYRVVGASTGWVDGVPGVEVVERNGSALVVELAESLSDQTLLDAARAAGPVHEFRPLAPTLTELFREAVSEPVESPQTRESQEVPA